MRRRGAFTMIELLIASAIATTLITILYSSLTFYSRSFQREDESLERSKRAQEVLGLFRDDFGRAAGEVRVEDVPLDALQASGWDGNAADFLMAGRPGINQINAWTGYGATSPYISKIFEFTEKGKESSYDRDGPPEALRRIAPRSPVHCVIHVALPRDKPLSEWILIRRESQGNATLALWTFHRAKVGAWTPGTLLRWSAATGTVRVGGMQVADFAVRLAHDWMYVDAAPPSRKEPDVRLLATMARVELRFGPGLEAGAVLVMGP